jgi:hypothetical protein
MNKYTDVSHLVCIQALEVSFPFELPQEAIVAQFIQTRRKVLAMEDNDVSATGY